MLNFILVIIIFSLLWTFFSPWMLCWSYVHLSSQHGCLVRYFWCSLVDFWQPSSTVKWIEQFACGYHQINCWYCLLAQQHLGICQDDFFPSNGCLCFLLQKSCCISCCMLCIGYLLRQVVMSYCAKKIISRVRLVQTALFIWIRDMTSCCEG